MWPLILATIIIPEMSTQVSKHVMVYFLPSAGKHNLLKALAPGRWDKPKFHLARHVSTWLDTFDVLSVSRRVCRAVLFDELDLPWAWHVERVKTWRAKWNLGYISRTNNNCLQCAGVRDFGKKRAIFFLSSPLKRRPFRSSWGVLGCVVSSLGGV